MSKWSLLLICELSQLLPRLDPLFLLSSFHTSIRVTGFISFPGHLGITIPHSRNCGGIAVHVPHFYAPPIIRLRLP
jgi:hypothetical protein